MTMTKLRTMAAPQVGDEYTTLADHVLCDCMGLPVAEPIAEPGFGRSCVVRVGAYWSDQPSGASGWYVELEPVHA